MPAEALITTPTSDPGTAPLRCRNCHEGSMEAFYEVRNIPVHSVLLMPSRERALDYPRRDLRLGFCSRCGFIGNMIFDASVSGALLYAQEADDLTAAIKEKILGKS